MTVMIHHHTKPHNPRSSWSRSLLISTLLLTTALAGLLASATSGEATSPGWPSPDERGGQDPSHGVQSSIFGLSVKSQNHSGEAVDLRSSAYPVIGKSNVADLNPILYLQGLENEVTTLAISPDSSHVASGSIGGVIHIWDSRSGEQLRSIEAHSATINDIAFSPDGSLLASGAEDRSAKLWEVETGELVRTFPGRLTGRILAVDFTPDGQYLAMAGHECLAVLRDVESGILFKTYKQRDCLPRSKGSVASWGIDFTADGGYIILGVGQPKCNCGSIQRWEVDIIASNELIFGYGTPVRDLDLSPDGSTVAVAMIGTDFIRLIDAHNVYPITDLEGHMFRVNSLDFSPDGDLLASGSNDQRIGLWDVENGEPMRLIHEHTDSVLAVQFSPDGSFLASTSKDGQVILWGVEAP